MKPAATFQRWVGGCNSLIFPDGIGSDQYAWGINVLHRGGIVQTRPGYKLAASVLTEGGAHKLQGSVIFTPRNSPPMMLVAVDGKIFGAQHPYRSFSLMPGISLDPDADDVIFQRVLKSVNRRTDPGNEGVLELIDPRPMVVIQDGITRPFTYDGSTFQQAVPGSPTFGIPIGTWMAWSGSRLWVASESRLHASDLASPDTFSETEYLAERSSFELPGAITGMVETSNRNGLIVFTENTTSVFQSGILDRPSWQTTPDFQDVILPSIGCIAGRSATNQYGLTWWMSRSGYINLDAALSSQHTSKVQTVDGEMSRSKSTMFRRPSGACATNFENFLIVSVPSGSRKNTHTWVMDQEPTGRGATAATWAGVWTGMRPFQWMKSNHSDGERLWCVSSDRTERDGTPVHVWEVFRTERHDNNGRILCQMETGMLFTDVESRFAYAEISVAELLGDVELKAFVGGYGGPWHEVLDTTLQAEAGSMKKEVSFTKDTILQTYKPQSRPVRTVEFSPQGLPCSPEIVSPGRSRGVQLLIEWRGRMGIKAVKLVANNDPEEDRGRCQPQEQGLHNIVTAAGDKI